MTAAYGLGMFGYNMICLMIGLIIIYSNKEYKMTTKSETIYESKTKHLRYLFDEHGNALPIYNDILDKFTTDEKAYYAGMIDGDGSIQYFKT